MECGVQNGEWGIKRVVTIFCGFGWFERGMGLGSFEDCEFCSATRSKLPPASGCLAVGAGGTVRGSPGQRANQVWHHSHASPATHTPSSADFNSSLIPHSLLLQVFLYTQATWARKTSPTLPHSALRIPHYSRVCFFEFCQQFRQTGQDEGRAQDRALELLFGGNACEDGGCGHT